MTKLDMFVKHTLKCKHYLRYCDDFCLFSNDKKYLNWCKEKIIEFVTNELDMKLSKCDLFKTKQGVDFVGYRHFPQYTLVRKRTAKKVKKRMLKIQYKLKNYELTQKELFKMNGQVASSYGWCKHADSYRFMKKYKIEECLKEIIMRYAEFKNKLHTNKMLSMKINDFINKEITITGWEYYKKNDNDEEVDEELTRENLINKLIEYKKYKEISKKLNEYYKENCKRFYKLPDKIELPKQKLEIEYSQNKELGNDLLLYKLLNHYSLKKQETIKLLFNKLPDNLSYTQKKYKIQNLLTKLRKQGKNLK